MWIIEDIRTAVANSLATIISVHLIPVMFSALLLLMIVIVDTRVELFRVEVLINVNDV